MHRFKVIIFLLQFLMVIVGTNGESILPCRFTESVNITSGEYNATDRTIFHDGVLYREENYATINYTVISYNQTETDDYIRGCVCQVANCVWLCCYTFSDVNGHPRCDDSEYNEIEVPLEDENSETRKVNLTSLENIFVVIRYSKDYVFDAAPDEWLMNSTGYIMSLDEKTPIQQNDYCVESDGYLLFPLTPDPLDEVLQKTIALSISLPFMLVTLLIYLCIPELRNLHGKCLISYIFAMIFCYSIMLYSKLDDKLYYCYYHLYFWTMAGFFWLNVLCFDIFWTFSSGVVKQGERRRFLYYSLYAWGCPLILLGLLALIDNTSFVPEDFRPQISAYHCYFGGEYSRVKALIYLYSILLVLIPVNLLFFVITLSRIIGIQRATDAILQRGSRRHNSGENRYRIHLYLRLFVVMGVMWMFEVISFGVCPEGSCMLVTDILNCLLGVFIFLMFVCKTNVKQMILKRISNDSPLSRSKSNHTISTSVTSSTREATVPLRQMSRMESCLEKYSNDRYS